MYKIRLFAFHSNIKITTLFLQNLQKTYNFGQQTHDKLFCKRLLFRKQIKRF